MTLSGAITPGQSGPARDGNEGVLYIPQSSGITGTLPSDCLVSYPGHSWEESYHSAEVQSVYFTTPADWAIQWLIYHKTQPNETKPNLKSKSITHSGV